MHVILPFGLLSIQLDDALRRCISIVAKN